MGQNSALTYAQALQAALEAIVTPTPVYGSFNRNFATEPTFITWTLRNVHQPVYTGPQSNKGIDRPLCQVNVYAQVMQTCFDKAQAIVNALHGYQGTLGGLFYVAKIDVEWLFNTFDDDNKTHQIVLELTLDIPS
jgi:hypothetical protein